MIIINNVVTFDQICDYKFGFVACATEINLLYFFLRPENQKYNQHN